MSTRSVLEAPRPWPAQVHLGTRVAEDHWKSPVEVTLSVLGGRWKPLVVWHLFWGPRPFAQLVRLIDGVTTRTLQREIRQMTTDGVVSFGSEGWAEYSLTPFGQTLKPIVAEMYEWGLRNDGL